MLFVCFCKIDQYLCSVLRLRVYFHACFYTFFLTLFLLFFVHQKLPITQRQAYLTPPPGPSMDDQRNLHFHLTACSQDASAQSHISTSVTYAEPRGHSRPVTSPRAPGATWMCAQPNTRSISTVWVRSIYCKCVTKDATIHTQINKCGSRKADLVDSKLYGEF